MSNKLNKSSSLLDQIKIVHKTWKEHEHQFESFSRLASQMPGILLSVDVEFFNSQSSDMVSLRYVKLFVKL